MPDLARLIRDTIRDMPDLRALALNPCSANSAYWRLYDYEQDEEEGFNIDNPQKEAYPSSTGLKYKDIKESAHA